MKIADFVKCGKCKYWVQEKEGDEFGECRKFPPQLVTNDYTEWPVTIKKDFCGEGKIKAFFRHSV